MQAAQNFLAGGRSISTRQGELCCYRGSRDYRVSRGNGTVGDRENPSRGICHPLYDRRRARSLARVKGVTRTESFVRNADPPLTYLPTPTYARAYYPAVCIGIRP